MHEEVRLCDVASRATGRCVHVSDTACIRSGHWSRARDRSAVDPANAGGKDQQGEELDGRVANGALSPGSNAVSRPEAAQPPVSGPTPIWVNRL